MIYGGLDTETTGFDPKEHRFVELYLGIYEAEVKMDEFHTLVDPQRSIPIEASRVHGFFASNLIGAPTFEDVADDFVKALNRCDVLVAHNGLEFDLPFINAQLQHSGRPPINKPMIDTMLGGRAATPNGSVPSLGNLAFGMNVRYDPGKAHKADYDVDVMMKCFFRGLKWGMFELPED